MKEAKIYDGNKYNCDVRSAENLDKIYDTRRDWTNGLFEYNSLHTKAEIIELLKDNLVAVEGLEEISEEDSEYKLKD